MTPERLSGRTVRLDLDGDRTPVPTAAVLRRPNEVARALGAPIDVDVSPRRPLLLVSLGPNLLEAPVITRVERREDEVVVRYRVVPRRRLPCWAADDVDWLDLLFDPVERSRAAPYHLVSLDRVVPGERFRFARERERVVHGRIRCGGGRATIVERPLAPLAARRTEAAERLRVRHGVFRGAAASTWQPGGAPGGALLLDPPCRAARRLVPRIHEVRCPRAAAAIASRPGAPVRASGLVVPETGGRTSLDLDLVVAQDEAGGTLYALGLERTWGRVRSDFPLGGRLAGAA